MTTTTTHNPCCSSHGVAAAMEQMAEKIWQEFGVGNEDDECYVSGVDDAIMMLRAEAKRLRGEQS